MILEFKLNHLDFDYTGIANDIRSNMEGFSKLFKPALSKLNMEDNYNCLFNI